MSWCNKTRIESTEVPLLVSFASPAMFDHLAASNVSSSICDLAAYAVLFSVILKPYSPAGRVQDRGSKARNLLMKSHYV